MQFETLTWLIIQHFLKKRPFFEEPNKLLKGILSLEWRFKTSQTNIKLRFELQVFSTFSVSVGYFK